MGPKAKQKDKNPKPETPAIDPKEVVTELDKEFFVFQLSEIEKKISRIELREEELRVGTTELEDKIEECKNEKEAQILQQQENLTMKQAEKVRKREEALSLAELLKGQTQRHIEHVEELEEKYNRMVQELSAELKEVEEEVRILEDFKLRKEMYISQLSDLESVMSEAEMQQQRNLFYIEQKAEIAKHRVKKELQFKLLQLSIEFRQTTQKRIGKPSHRITQENKAIENELRLMTYDIIEYEENCIKAKEAVKKYKEENEMWLMEMDKGIARVVVQMSLKKALLLDRFKLLEKHKEYFPYEVQNKALTRKLKTITLDIEKILKEIEDVKQNIEKIVEETNEMNEASLHLKKSSRRLNLHVRNALKIAEEARAVRLIPMGGMEEERYITTDAKIRLFKKRRDSTFRRKGKILHYLIEFLLQGQLNDDDKKFLRRSSASFDIDTISFTHIFKKSAVDREEGKEGSFIELEEDIGPYVGEGSEGSLPRSVTPTTRSVKSDDSGEGEEEESGKHSKLKDKEKLRESKVKERESRDRLRESKLKQKESREKLRESKLKQKESREKLRESRLRERDSRVRERDSREKLRESRVRERDSREKLRESRVRERDSREKLRESRVRERDSKEKLRESRVRERDSREKLRESRVRERDSKEKLRESRVKERDSKEKLRESRAKQKESKVAFEEQGDEDTNSRPGRSLRYEDYKKSEESMSAHHHLF